MIQVHHKQKEINRDIKTDKFKFLRPTLAANWFQISFSSFPDSFFMWQKPFVNSFLKKFYKPNQINYK